MAITLPPAEIKERLRHQFLGKRLLEVPAPLAILDLSKLKKNCAQMIDVVDKLEFGWRCHIKTHKTTELTELQVGNSPRPANIIVSTLKEAEQILPFLADLKHGGRKVNILYGFPVPPSSAQRLAIIARELGPESLSVIVDHPAQLPTLSTIQQLSGVVPQVYVKIDMGYHRAGVLPDSLASSQLISDVLKAEESGAAVFHGLYTHAGHSYAGNDRGAAVDLLRRELESVIPDVERIEAARPGRKLVLSVGATPTTISTRNLLEQESSLTAIEQAAISALKTTITAIKAKNCEIELHAGVYCSYDIQQLSTRAVSIDGQDAMMTWSDLALTVLVEVASLYPGRGKMGTPEALIAAGSLALGREPCKAYPGWGVVSPWNISSAKQPESNPEQHKCWQVGKISQEHGVLTWAGDESDVVPLTIGQKIRIWPNHSCIAGACFDWYVIVDSEREGKEDEIVDVWPRWRGW